VILASASIAAPEMAAWILVPANREDIHETVVAALGESVRIETTAAAAPAASPGLVIADFSASPDAHAQARWAGRGASILAIVADEAAGIAALGKGATHVLLPPFDSPMARLTIRGAYGTHRVDTVPPPEDAHAVENQLQHSARLATIGEISAAVAHEINNPLQFMTVCLDELRAHITRSFPGHQGSELRSLLDDALEGLERIRSITVELLPFARSSPSEIEQVDLNKVLMRAMRMMRNDLRHRARLVSKLDRLPVLRGDPRRLAQVFTNVLLNASQAIEEGNADENRIEVIARHAGDEIVVEVMDSGMGIPKDHLDRVFERFFTTKPSGLGTGLGMSVSHEIVSNHGGRIEISSEVGKGTHVTIVLPVTTPLEVKTISSEPLATAKRSLRILAIDDDLLVLKSYRRALGRDHQMTFASDGQDALSELEEDASFDVILCDLMMPNMDGPLFYEALAKAHPELIERIVFCSGGTFTPRAEQFVATCARPLVHKPIHPTELLAVLLDTAEQAEEAGS
jgi:signal transduction histidine kinase/ActR/RegA family two-component response regulator